MLLAELLGHVGAHVAVLLLDALGHLVRVRVRVGVRARASVRVRIRVRVKVGDRVRVRGNSARSVPSWRSASPSARR